MVDVLPMVKSECNLKLGYEHIPQQELSKQLFQWEQEQKYKKKATWGLEVQYDPHGGAETDIHVLHPHTAFSLEGLEKAVRRLMFRNWELQHTFDGREEWNPGAPPMANLVREKFGGEPLEPPAPKRLFELMFDPAPVNDYLQYHTPLSVMVLAGFRFYGQSLTGVKGYRRFLGSCADLSTIWQNNSINVGVSLDENVWRSCNFLSGILQARMDSGREEDMFYLQGESMFHGPKIGRSGYGAWRGKVQHFANFVHTMEKASPLLGINSPSLQSASSPSALELLFYDNGGGHEHDDAAPETIIGMVRDIPGKETRIYSGKELGVQYKIIEKVK